MDAPASTRSSRLAGDLAAVALTVAWLFALRAAFECPWGFAPVAGPDGLRFGIPFNANDTWFYLSWVEQYRTGSFGAEILYSPVPHAQLLWSAPLWLIGRVAALTGLSALGVYNVAGVLGAAGTVFCFRRAACSAGFSIGACDWGTVVLVLGSGASWVWHLTGRLGWTPPADGAEFRYLDFFPSTAFAVFPYHALAMRCSRRFGGVSRRPRRAWLRDAMRRAPLAGVAALAAALTMSRPYEPIAFAAAYAVKAAWTWRDRRSSPVAWSVVRRTGAVLAAGLAPGLRGTPMCPCSGLVELRPSGARARIRPHRMALRVRPLWLLCVFGLGAARRLPHARGLLAVTASAWGAVLLVGFGHAGVKLASGSVPRRGPARRLRRGPSDRLGAHPRKPLGERGGRRARAGRPPWHPVARARYARDPAGAAGDDGARSVRPGAAGPRCLRGPPDARPGRHPRRQLLPGLIGVRVCARPRQHC